MPRHLATRRRGAVVALVLASSVLTACGGASAPEPAPSPSVVPLRAVEACPADVGVPEDSFDAEPSAATPPTVSLPTGSAVTLTVPAGARVGIIGSADAGDDAQLCAAPSSTAGQLVYVALTPGYARIGIQTGIEAPLRVFVKVAS